MIKGMRLAEVEKEERERRFLGAISLKAENIANVQVASGKGSRPWQVFGP
jgi:hypothetical protein